MTKLRALRTALVGRPYHNERYEDTALSKRAGLPVFSADSLSSVAYAPDEIVLTLALAGASAVLLSPWVGLAVVVVTVIIVLAYRQNLRAYPSGQGDYEIATSNLGDRAGVVVGASLMIDFTLVVAVSMSAAAQYLAAAFPGLIGFRLEIALAGILIAGLLNLRGLRFMGRAAAVPTYLFVAVLLAMIGTGLYQSATGTLDRAASADWEVLPVEVPDGGWTGMALAILVLRAFSSGAVAVTGVESVAGSVPFLRRPRAANARIILTVMGVLSVVLLLGTVYLARATGVQLVLDPERQLRMDGHAPEADFYQNPVLGQLARAIFGLDTPLYYVVILATVLVLVLAASTAFTGFPALASRLARDSSLPRQFAARGDRFAFTNGIVVLLVVAAVLTAVFGANVNALVQLYVVGVFVSFTLTQFGMARHWRRHRRAEPTVSGRRRIVASLGLAVLAAVISAAVLVVVMTTRFTQGAWITVVCIVALSLFMSGIRRHYDAVDDALQLAPDSPVLALPSRVHAMLIVPSVRKPDMRALAYARASRPSTLEALVVDVSAARTARILEQWQRLEIPVPLRVLDAPYRSSTQPVIDHLRRVRRRSPRDLVVVYLPEYVVSTSWERFLHNQATGALRSRLRHERGVMIASVPWHLNTLGAQVSSDEDAPHEQSSEAPAQVTRRAARRRRRRRADREALAARSRTPRRRRRRPADRETPGASSRTAPIDGDDA